MQGREDTVTVADADLMTEIGDHGRALYLKGKRLTRAKRLAKRGFLVQGRLGAQYYDLHPERGVAFYKGRRAFQAQEI
ncbi:MAG: hypothetical protein K0U16_07480 [Gammaproteobacteria bacterium]|nr:hypothetical protein [Gammaproteobacteria bacterium]